MLLSVNVFKLEDGCICIFEPVFFPKEGDEDDVDLEYKIRGVAGIEYVVGEYQFDLTFQPPVFADVSDEEHVVSSNHCYRSYGLRVMCAPKRLSLSSIHS